MDPLKGLKATTCKEAISRWEEKTGNDPAKETDINLCFQWPPMEKMDSNLGALESVQKLSLSSNNIDRIAGINSLKNLRILSLARNNIKSFSGLEGVGDHLEQLWISYNMIDKTKGAPMLKALKVLYMGNNMVRDWAEFNRLQELPALEDLLFANNPLCENMDEEAWRETAIKRLPNLRKLDSIPIVHATDDDDDEF